MRILFGIVIALVLAALAWSVSPTVGKPESTASINTLGMMTTATNLPTDPECDQGTVFLPAGVHYN